MKFQIDNYSILTCDETKDGSKTVAETKFCVFDEWDGPAELEIGVDTAVVTTEPWLDIDSDDLVFDTGGMA